MLRRIIMGVHDFSVNPKKEKLQNSEKPTEREVLDAVRTLLRWTGDNPERDGLKDTPRRVLKAYSEWFGGYNEDPKLLLCKTFEEVKGYNDWVILDSIRVESYCEHHLAPIIGVAKVGYLPSGLVVGISKLVRVVNAYSKSLQIQERLTREIAMAINEALNPKSVAVAIKAEHHCMCTRGVNKPGTKMLTSSFIGEVEKNPDFRRAFLEMD